MAIHEHFRPNDLTRATFSDGKYTIIQRADGYMEFLRHGEPWPAANDSDWKYAGMILGAAQEIASLRERLAELKDLLSRVEFPDTTGR